MNLGAPELLIVLVVVLVLFGGAKLPKLARSLGEARREFETANDEAERAALRRGSDPASPATPPAPTAAEREAELARREAELARRESEARGTDA
ncbi:MAG TPA: twin-arginine translocase TatA/TatE family subunit [Iamia sp.]|nr:twin-arginine translocase TatA/TatE family subunit [Iamia sp.]